jgi:hypothetical protein
MKKFDSLFICLTLLALTAGGALAKKTVPTESYGNNLSTPAIFAEGVGVLGLPTGENTGLRGSSVPNLVKTYEYNDIPYYLQRTENTWQADWLNGAAEGEVVRADWSDNIVRQTWAESSVIRVETVLFKDLDPARPLKGYDMNYLFGEGIQEVWGTPGTTHAANLATVYSICARLTIQKLDGPDGRPVGTLYDSAIYDRFGVTGPTSAYSAEVNVPGKIIYGYNWDLAKFDMAGIGLPNEPKSGWYRLTFSLDPTAVYNLVDENGQTRGFTIPCNTVLGSLDAADLLGTALPEVVVYEPKLPSGQTTTLDLYIKPATGGKKK